MIFTGFLVLVTSLAFIALLVDIIQYHIVKFVTDEAKGVKYIDCLVRHIDDFEGIEVLGCLILVLISTLTLIGAIRSEPFSDFANLAGILLLVGSVSIFGARFVYRIDRKLEAIKEKGA